MVYVGYSYFVFNIIFSIKKMKTRTKIQLLIYFGIVLYLSYICAYHTLKTVYEYNNKDLVYLKNKKHELRY